MQLQGCVLMMGAVNDGWSSGRCESVAVGVVFVKPPGGCSWTQERIANIKLTGTESRRSL